MRKLLSYVAAASLTVGGLALVGCSHDKDSDMDHNGTTTGWNANSPSNEGQPASGTYGGTDQNTGSMNSSGTAYPNQSGSMNNSGTAAPENSGSSAGTSNSPGASNGSSGSSSGTGTSDTGSSGSGTSGAGSSGASQ